MENLLKIITLYITLTDDIQQALEYLGNDINKLVGYYYQLTDHKEKELWKTEQGYF